MSIINYETVQVLKRIVGEPSLTVEQRETMQTDDLRRDAAQRMRVETAATEAVARGGCRGVPVACVLCARGQITCEGVRAIILDGVANGPVEQAINV